jgi:hypothetical protein
MSGEMGRPTGGYLLRAGRSGGRVAISTVPL